MLLTTKKDTDLPFDVRARKRMFLTSEELRTLFVSLISVVVENTRMLNKYDEH